MSRDGRRRHLTYEERVLWTAVTKSMTPLRETPAAAVDLADDSEAEAPPLRKPPTFVKPVKSSKIVAVASYAPPPQAPPPPALSPLTRRMKRNVARGKEQIDARLDLHGLTQHQAHDTLLRFLRAASARDARLVLVITGKGKRIDGDNERERGVLRRQVPHWLGLPEFRAVVLGFEDAAISHGGEGALYVRVRRGRG
ncbi:MAG: DNA mismatch repair protein MutS [Rhodopseudomonas sp.]|nr:DNA mismatch repair protein MutS [Rhodopseudomonas sp.]